MQLVACKCLLTCPEVKKWNEKIKKQFHMGNSEQAILTYLKIQQLGFHANNYTFPILLKAAERICASQFGFALHGQTIKTGFCTHVFVQTALISLYSTLHLSVDAFKVFDKMPVKDLVAWNSMLDGYASNAQMDCALSLFNSMPLRDTLSFNIMISGYSSCNESLLARHIFDEMAVKDIASWNSMISAYTRAGEFENGLTLFREMPEKNTVTWNTVITGCLQSKRYGMILDLFEEMQATNCMPDYLTVTGVLSACAHLGSLEAGTRIHRYAIDNMLASIPHVTTALIDMYAKCGSIDQALHVFYKSHVKDIYCWNALISALALHGQGYAALKIFDEMWKNNVKPDDITFIGLLNACSHSGLVQEGCRLVSSMAKDYGISLKAEHYACVVDLLGRGGHPDLALQLIEGMPFEARESILGALLGACIIHQDIEIGERVIKLVSSTASCLSDGELMMFSNLYASCGKWEEANRWREMMNNSGIVKTAGYSAIEVSGRSQKFLAGQCAKLYFA